MYVTVVLHLFDLMYASARSAQAHQVFRSVLGDLFAAVAVKHSKKSC